MVASLSSLSESLKLETVGMNIANLKMVKAEERQVRQLRQRTESNAYASLFIEIYLFYPCEQHQN
jgi:transcriptional regulator of met regulon